nr:MAG TPA: hypothetical protein [Caudoviricetes sp.]
MKRVLSWIVAGLCTWAFRFVTYLLFALALWILGKMYSFSEVLFWVFVILEGTTVLGISIWLIIVGSKLVVTASQSVWKSVKGTRYTVIGILNIVVYGLNLCALIAGTARVTNPAYVAAYIASVIFGIAIIFIGKSTVEEDGAPPTQIEAMEQKLKMLKEKEAKKGNET